MFEKIIIRKDEIVIIHALFEKYPTPHSIFISLCFDVIYTYPVVDLADTNLIVVLSVDKIFGILDNVSCNFISFI